MRNLSLAVIGLFLITGCGFFGESSEKKISTPTAEKSANSETKKTGDLYAEMDQEETAEISLWNAGMLAPDKLLEKYDTDNDGKISAEEREAAKKAFIAECDKDDDGELSRDERKACFIEKSGFDVNKDGKLDDEEKKALLEARKKKMQERWAELKKKCIEKYDLNKDGELDDEEKAKMKEDFMAKLEAWKESMDERRAEWCAMLKKKLEESEDKKPFLERLVARCEAREAKADEEEENKEADD